MAFTAQEVANIAAGALDYYFGRAKVYAQTIQNKPLLTQMERTAKSFPGGKGDISLAVQGAYGDGSADAVLKGFTHDDTVTFYNEANVQRANYAWREHHLGIEISYTEMKMDGISVVDTGSNKGQTTHSGAEKTRLFSLIENKMESFAELHSRQMNTLLWGDGTADASALAGIRALITADPSVGTVGGINRATASNAWWRNRARTAAFGVKVAATPALAAHGGGAVQSSAALGGELIRTLETEYRQLVKYGGKPTVFLCGSDFLDAYQLEMRSNGQYSQTGFAGSQDGAFGDARFKGMKLQYDPTLDDLGLAKRAYLFDPKDVCLIKMEGEWRRQHTPARPANQFMLKRSMTSTGQMMAKRCNSALVIEVA